MGYFKYENDQYILGISTIDQVEHGNITKEEYLALDEIFHRLPEGKVVHDNGDGTYSYIDNPNPPDPEPDLSADEIVDIIFGGVS